LSEKINNYFVLKLGPRFTE